ncbi:hypothetical protein K439DRAFT_1357100 [Ramaria rubella]|nr:hypothetical protein K439DRAFT_1357100 [Ramaria rubella]
MPTRLINICVTLQLMNECNPPVASFHHPGSAYLVPDLIKKTHSGAATMALSPPISPIHFLSIVS